MSMSVGADGSCCVCCDMATPAQPEISTSASQNGAGLSAPGQSHTRTAWLEAALLSRGRDASRAQPLFSGSFSLVPAAGAPLGRKKHPIEAKDRHLFWC